MSDRHVRRDRFDLGRPCRARHRNGDVAIARIQLRTHRTPLAESPTSRRLSPRIAKLTEKQLYRPRPASHYKQWPRAGPLLRHHAQIDVIDAQWDDLLRIGASLKQGYVSAALLISKLQAGSRQHPLSKAMLEYGKLLRTLHALRWFTDEAFRRRIGRQLNRGEALNDLRRP